MEIMDKKVGKKTVPEALHPEPEHSGTNSRRKLQETCVTQFSADR